LSGPVPSVVQRPRLVAKTTKPKFTRPGTRVRATRVTEERRAVA
jgi:hypothetical protein